MSPPDLYHANALFLGKISKTIDSTIDGASDKIIDSKILHIVVQKNIHLYIFVYIQDHQMLLFDFCFHVYLVVSPIYCGQQFRIFLVYMYNLSYQNYIVKS